MILSFRDEYFFLSNFYPVEIKLDGIVYPNAEEIQESIEEALKEESA